MMPHDTPPRSRLVKCLDCDKLLEPHDWGGVCERCRKAKPSGNYGKSRNRNGAVKADIQYHGDSNGQEW